MHRFFLVLSSNFLKLCKYKVVAISLRILVRCIGSVLMSEGMPWYHEKLSLQLSWGKCGSEWQHDNDVYCVCCRVIVCCVLQPGLCEASYVLLEYARTAMFMWMFIEGLYLHNMVTGNTMHIPYYEKGLETIVYACLTYYSSTYYISSQWNVLDGSHSVVCFL